MSEPEELRVVIVAEHASERFGGEAILPLHYFTRLRRRGIDAWLVVHERTREELDELLPLERERIHYISDDWINRASWKLGAWMPDRVRSATIQLASHLHTQRRQRKVVRELVRRHGANVVHEPIPVAPKFPSVMHSVGAPVIIGPMNGGMDYPCVLRPQGKRKWIESWGVRLGRGISGVINRLAPGKRRAALLLVANQRTAAALPAGLNQHVREFVENGVDLGRWPLPPRDAARSADGKVRFIFVGRLVEEKGIGLLLDATRIVADLIRCELHVVGGGPLEERIGKQIRRLSLGDTVVLHGFVPQARCAPLVGQADVLMFPTLFDCGGAVVLEAMAMGKPVIATRWGGPIDYLDESCGILIDPAPRAVFVANLAAAMKRLAQDEELRRRLGAAGRARIEERFDWEKKIDRMLEIYREVVRGQ